LYVELARTHRELASEADDQYVDQHNSPLGSRLHLRLVRRGELTGYNVGRRVLVRRADMNSYLERHRVSLKEAPPGEEESFEALVARFGKGKVA